jgi:hypothetical protein
MPTPEARAERWKRAGVRVWTIIGALVLAGVALYLLRVIWPAVLPFLMAAVIVFILRAPVGWIEKDGLPRWAAVLICYIIATVALPGPAFSADALGDSAAVVGAPPALGLAAVPITTRWPAAGPGEAAAISPAT